MNDLIDLYLDNSKKNKMFIEHLISLLIYIYRFLLIISLRNFFKLFFKMGIGNNKHGTQFYIKKIIKLNNFYNFMSEYL